VSGEALLALARDDDARKFRDLSPDIRTALHRRYLALRAEFEELWHVDNRAGGVELTLAWFDKMLAELAD